MTPTKHPNNSKTTNPHLTAPRKRKSESIRQAAARTGSNLTFDPFLFLEQKDNMKLEEKLVSAWSHGLKKLNEAPRPTIASVARRLRCPGDCPIASSKASHQIAENPKRKGGELFFARSHFSVQNLSPPQYFLSDFDETCFLLGPRC